MDAALYSVVAAANVGRSVPELRLSALSSAAGVCACSRTAVRMSAASAASAAKAPRVDVRFMRFDSLLPGPQPAAGTRCRVPDRRGA